MNKIFFGSDKIVKIKELIPIKTQRFLKILFPPFCVSCQRLNYYLCPSCYQKIEFLKQQYCAYCGQPSLEGLTHYHCRRRYGLDRCQSAVFYRGPIRPLIKKFKYHQARVLLPLIKNLFQRYFTDPELLIPAQKTLIIPIPLHPRRLKERSFNQAQLLAEIAEELWNLPSVADLLIKTKDTPSQTQLSGKERRHNLQNAFAINPARQHLLKQYSTFLLIDDVITTGTTLISAARVLKRKGAPRVEAITLAHD